MIAVCPMLEDEPDDEAAQAELEPEEDDARPSLADLREDEAVDRMQEERMERAYWGHE